MADTAASVPVRAKKLRSPSYPSIDLGTAIKRAESFYDKERRNSAPLRIAVQHWGTTEKSSAAQQTVAALKSFGLMTEIDGVDRRLQLSELGLRIVLDKREVSAEREQAIKRAALMPKMHQLLWSKYGEHLPSEQNLAHELVFDWRFNENSVRDFIREYKSTVTFAKLSSSDTLSEDGSDKPEDLEEEDSSHGPMLQVGEFVQWESQGQLQFRDPKRVRALSEDGQWAFIEGSNTGLPVDELTVVSKPDNPPLGGRGTRNQKTPPTLEDFDDNAIRQDVCSLDEGEVIVRWPKRLSSESAEDLMAWLDLLKRRIARAAQEPLRGDN